MQDEECDSDDWRTLILAATQLNSPKISTVTVSDQYL
jgi:hypothetical protein